jgi:hypothetical protein
VLDEREPARVVEASSRRSVRASAPDHAALSSAQADGSWRPLAATALDLSGPAERCRSARRWLRRVRADGLACWRPTRSATPLSDAAGSVHGCASAPSLCVPLGAPVRGVL